MTRLNGFFLATAFLLAMTSCQSGGGPSQTLPDATIASQAVGASIQSADDHVAAAATQAKGAQTEVRTAIPLTLPPASSHLRTADGQLTQVQGELTAARAQLHDALQSNVQVQAELVKATQELATITADAKKYRDKYDNQWFAGKFWTAFWVTMISLALIIIGCLVLNYYTNIFVVPLQHIGKWIADIFSSTVKAAWNVVSGIWTELASLFKKKSTPTPAAPSASSTIPGAGTLTPKGPA
jgi:hypothetical protein